MAVSDKRGILQGLGLGLRFRLLCEAVRLSGQGRGGGASLGVGCPGHEDPAVFIVDKAVVRILCGAFGKLMSTGVPHLQENATP